MWFSILTKEEKASLEKLQQTLEALLRYLEKLSPPEVKDKLFMKR